MSSLDLDMALRFPCECTEGVARGDEFEPCDKPAVAVRIDVEHGTYPVCARHARAPMVSLAAVISAAKVDEAQIRASIAAEFDALAAKLTASIARMEPGSDSDVILRDRRAQMATAAQMVRGGGTS